MSDDKTTPDATVDTRKRTVSRKKDGVGTHGLYIGYILYDKASGRLMREERLFLARNLVGRYSRKNGDKRAAWRAYSFANHDAAREFLTSSIQSRVTVGIGMVMPYPPMAVELGEADIESLNKGEAPYARHLGPMTVEKIIGKLDDASWAPPVEGV